MKPSETTAALRLTKQLTMLVAMLFFCIPPTGSWGETPRNKLFEVNFEYIDSDKNGTITLDEFINTPLGLIKKNDLQRLVQQKIPPESLQEGEVYRFELTADEKRKIFESIDQDKNKLINRKEWTIFKDGNFMLK